MGENQLTFNCLEQEIILRQFCVECQVWRGEDLLRPQQWLCSGELYNQVSKAWDKLSIKIWDLNTLAKIREQELHDKGVKCIDINNKVILTGSYDATLKVRYLENFYMTRSNNASDSYKYLKHTYVSDTD